MLVSWNPTMNAGKATYFDRARCPSRERRLLLLLLLLRALVQSVQARSRTQGQRLLQVRAPGQMGWGLALAPLERVGGVPSGHEPIEHGGQDLLRVPTRSARHPGGSIR